MTRDIDIRVEQWREQALCADSTSPDLWFPERDGQRPHRERVRPAVDVCHRCPVRRPCLQWALTQMPPYGIYGGFDFGWKRDRDELDKIADRLAS
ncbi:WhiB family transcriptional regulator [Rhodococcus rhodnii]|uniref:WhiB family transcriptional regulator n=1 Tax=Rhodococcus rhodnii TaxID=38312 RepID=UPI000934DC83|nr:WhiB family transcriptional regulator [Rhodococcus rhodnii]